MTKAARTEHTDAAGGRWFTHDSGQYDLYGRPIRPERRFWTQSAPGPHRAPHLAGIVGFYSATIDEVEARLKARKTDEKART